MKRLLKQPIGGHLRRAFAKLEREKGATVDIEKAWGMVGQAIPTLAPASTRAPAGQLRVVLASAPMRQQWSFSEDNVELIFLPAVSEEGYWVGTFVATHYDDVGNADIYEVINVEMMYTRPTAAGWDSSYADPIYEGPPPDRDPLEMTEAKSTPALRHAQLLGTDRVQIRRVKLKWLGRFKSWLGCSVAWCAGAAGGCALGNWWNAEIAWAPCTGMGCTGVFIGCTYGSLWEWQ